MPPTPAAAQKQGGSGKVRVSLAIFFMMLMAALLIDALQFLASFLTIVAGIGIIIAWFLALIATVGFGLWFALLGVNYFTGKQAARKALTAISSIVIEFIPIIDDLPAITAGVVLMFLFSRFEDAEADVEAASFKRAQDAVRFAQGGSRIPTVEGRQSSPLEPWGYGQMRGDILAGARGRRYDEADEEAPPEQNTQSAAPENAGVVRPTDPYREPS